MATYRYGKSTKVKRVRAVGPTSRELEARMASYSYTPPGTYHHDVGDIPGQTSVAKKKQRMAQLQRQRQMDQGWDGAPNRSIPGPARIDPLRTNARRSGWNNSIEGTEDPHAREKLAGRRRKGNRYYRTD